ncbi:hypothetical protein QJS10_CPB18g01669 [Acorus calamus]|uniref:Uncharacterized protein n=1 Tax=Acorus calamus TaxID=4465 RepID=A0AAV9CKE0_ACOCL|nr:hypothetical protein QJS10_CPB18g01669 [Acorus calamus]
MIGTGNKALVIGSSRIYEVEGHGSFFVAPEDEVIEVENLLVEPQNGKGLMDSNVTQDVKYESNEFLDSMLQEIHDESNLHITSDISGDCVDYLLDAGHVEKDSQLNYSSQSVLGNIGSEFHSLNFSERESNAEVEDISDLSNAITQLPSSTSDQSALFLDNMSIRELHDSFKSTFGRETSVKDKQWLKRHIYSGLKNLAGLGKSSSLLESGFSSIENDVDMFASSCNHSFERAYSPPTNISDENTQLFGGIGGKGTHPGTDVLENSIFEVEKIGFELLNGRNTENTFTPRKRSRKPTRRYIEESWDVNSRTCDGRLGTSSANSRNKLFRIGVHNQYQWKGLDQLSLSVQRALLGFLENDSSDLKDQRPLSVYPKRICGSDSESEEDMSDDSAVSTKRKKVSVHRKNHRLWNLSEVMKLIEGVSRYGVGRWTDIKRLMFSTSAHRTSVDLKDKWRNLLRASGAYMTGKKVRSD